MGLIDQGPTARCGSDGVKHPQLKEFHGDQLADIVKKVIFKPFKPLLSLTQSLV